MRRGGRLVTGIALVVALGASGCGPDICLNCEQSPSPTPGQDTVTLEGTIVSLGNVPNPPSDVTVVVCVDLPLSQPLPTCPTFFNAGVDSGGDFRRTRIPTGNMRVGFWIPSQDVGNQIIETDLFAELDGEGMLTNLSAGETVITDNVEIEFGSGIAPGIATADITVQAAPTPTPSPIPTITPVNTSTPVVTPTPLS